MKKRFTHIVVGSIILALGGLIILDLGLYPIAIVEMQPISKRRLNIEVQAAAQYWITAVKTYGGNIAALASEEMAQDLRRAALDHAINTILIRNELESRLGRSFDEVRGEKIQNALADSTLRESVPALYGIAFETYKKVFLLPLAEQEILEDRVRLEDDRAIDEWLAEKRQKSTIYLLSPEFTWKNGELIAK